MVWWGEVPEGGDICIHIADLCCCTAETNTALQSNYTPFFKKKYVSIKKPMVSSSILAEMQWVGKTHSTAGGRRFEAAGSFPSSCGRLWEDQSVRKRSLDFERERGNKCPVTGWHLWKEARDGGCLV